MLFWIYTRRIYFSERCVAPARASFPRSRGGRWGRVPESERVQRPLENRYSRHSAERMKMTEREPRSRYVNYHRSHIANNEWESRSLRFLKWRLSKAEYLAVKVTGSVRARRSLGRIFANWCKQYTVNGKNARRKTRAPCVSTHIRNLA